MKNTQIQSTPSGAGVRETQAPILVRMHISGEERKRVAFEYMRRLGLNPRVLGWVGTEYLALVEVNEEQYEKLRKILEFLYIRFESTTFP